MRGYYNAVTKLKHFTACSPEKPQIFNPNLLATLTEARMLGLLPLVEIGIYKSLSVPMDESSLENAWSYP
jgi:hypothetical protein